MVVVLLRVDRVPRPAERGAQHPVHELVSIAPDGRGEVGVQGEGEPRVTVLSGRHAARPHVQRGGQQARHEVLEQLAEGRVLRRRRDEVVERLAEAGGGAAIEGEAALLERVSILHTLERQRLQDSHVLRQRKIFQVETCECNAHEISTREIRWDGRGVGGSAACVSVNL